MIIKNKKNGTNILSYKNHGIVTKVTINSGSQVNITNLFDFSQIINKGDFEKSRGWFEIVSQDVPVINEEKIEAETKLEKAEKEVIEYTSENKKNN